MFIIIFVSVCFVFLSCVHNCVLAPEPTAVLRIQECIWLWNTEFMYAWRFRFVQVLSERVLKGMKCDSNRLVVMWNTWLHKVILDRPAYSSWTAMDMRRGFENLISTRANCLLKTLKTFDRPLWICWALAPCLASLSLRVPFLSVSYFCQPHRLAVTHCLPE